MSIRVELWKSALVLFHGCRNSDSLFILDVPSRVTMSHHEIPSHHLMGNSTLLNFDFGDDKPPRELDWALLAWGNKDETSRIAFISQATWPQTGRI